jgi:hypothetical protein
VLLEGFLPLLVYVHVGILEHLFNKLHSLPEEVHVELLEFSPGKGLQEVISTLEILNFIYRNILSFG